MKLYHFCHPCFAPLLNAVFLFLNIYLSVIINFFFFGVLKVAFKKIVEGHMDRKQCEHWFWFSRVQSSGLWGAKYSPLTSIILLYQEECVLKNVPHKWDRGCSHCSEHGNRGVRRE